MYSLSVLTSANIFNRANINMSTHHCIVYNGENNNHSITQARPVHTDNRRIGTSREEGENPTKEQEENGNNIYEKTASPEAELGG